VEPELHICLKIAQAGFGTSGATYLGPTGEPELHICLKITQAGFGTSGATYLGPTGAATPKTKLATGRLCGSAHICLTHHICLNRLVRKLGTPVVARA
jgi:hypothetical protein